MTNKILTFQKASRLTCCWISTGNLQHPLACVWSDADAEMNSEAASSSNDELGRMLLCA